MRRKYIICITMVLLMMGSIITYSKVQYNKNKVVIHQNDNIAMFLLDGPNGTVLSEIDSILSSYVFDEEKSVCTNSSGLSISSLSFSDGKLSLSTSSSVKCNVYFYEKLSGLFDENDNLIYSWNELIDNNYIKVTNGTLSYGSNQSGLRALAGKLVIDNSVTSIGSSAFDGCTSLTSIVVPESVTSIGQYAFANCSNLTSIVVRSGNTKYDSRDNSNAIIETDTNTLVVGCKNTTIPDGVTSIGKGAFQGCVGLSRITIPNSVTSIGRSAFMESGLTSIEMPNNITYIDEYTFYGSYLTFITIPESVTSIGKYAFSYSSLVDIEIPASITNIGANAFTGCGRLTYVTFKTTKGWKADSTSISSSSLSNTSTAATYLKTTYKSSTWSRS